MSWVEKVIDFLWRTRITITRDGTALSSIPKKIVEDMNLSRDAVAVGYRFTYEQLKELVNDSEKSKLLQDKMLIILTIDSKYIDMGEHD